MERIRAFDPQAVGGRDPSLAATYLQSGSHRRRRKWTESAAGVRVFSIPHEVMHVVDHWAKPELGRDISSRPPVEFRLGTAAPEQSPLLPAMHEFLRTFVQERISTQRELLRLYAENERLRDELADRQRINPAAGRPSPSAHPDDLVLPAELGHVAGAIASSRSILDLEDDWDEEGSVGYDEATWQRATEFLARSALRLWREYHLAIEAPRVLPGPEGSIDLHWQLRNRELLINIPPTVEEVARYYGDDRTGGHRVKGDLDPREPKHWLLMWLAE